MEPLEYEVGKWRDYANALGFIKPEQAEKDYLQELLLSELFSGSLAALLVLRGGTAISKVYGSGRFSEDIDLILKEDAGRKAIETGVDRALRGFGLYYPAEHRTVAYRNMLECQIRIRGPIYRAANNEQAKQTVRLDINTYERPIGAGRSMHRVAIYEDLRPYMLDVATAEELEADKIKSIMERTVPVARDLYDAWMLIKKQRVKPDLEMVDKKMRQYGKEEGERFSIGVLGRRIRQIGGIWDAELSRLMRVVPEYGEVKSDFERAIK